MANKDAAKKAITHSGRRRVFNLRRKRTMQDVVTSVRELISAGDKKGATALLPKLYKALDKAAKSGVLKKNTASRNKSRISRAVEQL